MPRGSAIVLDMGSGPWRRDVLAACELSGHTVATILVRAASLDEPWLEEYPAQGIPTVVRLTQSVPISHAVGHGRALAREGLQIELPLDSDDDLSAIKVLSSLGVATRVPVAVLRTATELALDLLTDALLNRASRSRIGPFADIVDGWEDEAFEIARLDFRDNDHFVDLRAIEPGGTAVMPARTAWEGVDVEGKRVPFLIERRPCAYCEGLLFCHGYLDEDGNVEACRSLFGELAEMVDIARRREQEQPKQSGPTAAARRSSLQAGERKTC